MTDRVQPKPPVKSRDRSGAAGGQGSPLVPVEGPNPSDCLLRALSAENSRERRLYSQMGLESPELDDEMEGLLLRQLYLVELEEGDDLEALGIAEEMIDLGTLGDIARQDAARAAVALGELAVAADHIAIAAQICPTNRRSFHYCHLGAVLGSLGQREKSLEALREARRWASSDEDMYEALLAIAESSSTDEELEEGERAQFHRLRDKLEQLPQKKGYLLWVLGELCYRAGDAEAARSYLTQFLDRLDGAPRAKSLSLRSEIDHATQLLKKTLA